MFKKTLAATALASILAGCGGGGSASNKAPKVTVSNTSLQESAQIILRATVSDEDGSIASYQWTQKSGFSLSLNNTDTAAVEITAPAVTQSEQAVLTITVTDDAGSSSSADAIVTIEPNLISFKLAGNVTGASGALANVDIQIGEHSFTAAANESGEYSVDISLDDSFAQLPVAAFATGTNQYAHVKMASMVGNLNSLYQSAQDGIVSNAQVAATNISSISSIIYTLTQQQSAKTAASFESALKQIELRSIMSMATALKLVNEHSADNEDLALPDAFNHSLELISVPEALHQYITLAKKDHKALYDATNNTLIEQLSSSFPNAHNFTNEHFYFLGEGYSFGLGQLELREDQTGVKIDRSRKANINWNSSSSGLEVSYQEPIMTHQGPQWFPAYQTSFEVEHFDTKYDYRLLAETDETAVFHVTKHSIKRFPNGEFPETSRPPVSYIGRAIKDSTLGDIANFMEVGKTYSLPRGKVETPIVNSTLSGWDLSYYVLSVTLEDNQTATAQIPSVHGDGRVTYAPQSLNYRFTDDGHFELFDDSNQLNLRYALVLENGKAPRFNLLAKEGETTFSHTAWALEKSNDTEWDTNNLAGIYEYAVNPSFEWLNRLWFEVNADGTAVSVITNDINRNGQLEENEFSVMPGFWQINSRNNLVVRRYRMKESTGSRDYCMPTAFEPADDADCVLYHERELNLHQVVGNTHYVQHLHHFYQDMYRSPTDDPSTGHILWFSTIDNRTWTRLEQAPHSLPPTANKNGTGSNSAQMEELLKREISIQ
ncbi:hypothetical protein [Pleionea sp. CnH1-48]|uniref:PKD domain-containing protein n=1 Tax=Pleionea sp. CnH1-48 TaxID=2954494 RepID=UPI0020969F31|nr:hypothetical protein [Pleionea sp. CnH1-48]MCO7224280.1 hypothetical protein [Pleionea sp. CnH1-48]